jgi:hypothetical protein
VPSPVPETKASCAPRLVIRGAFPYKEICGAKAFEVEMKRPRECPELIGLIEEWRAGQGAPEPHDFRSIKRYAGDRKTEVLLDKG